MSTANPSIPRVELVLRMSTRTSSPRDTSCFVTCEPKNPLAPTTSFFRVIAAFARLSHSAQPSDAAMLARFNRSHAREAADPQDRHENRVDEQPGAIGVVEQ